MHRFLKLTFLSFCIPFSLTAMQLRTIKIATRTMQAPMHSHHYSTKLPYNPNNNHKTSDDDKALTQTSSKKTTIYQHERTPNSPMKSVQSGYAYPSSSEEEQNPMRTRAPFGERIYSCPCIRPYFAHVKTNIPDPKWFEQLHKYDEEYECKMKQLTYILEEFSDNTQITEKIITAQQQLKCPSLATCYNNIRSECRENSFSAMKFAGGLTFALMFPLGVGLGCGIIPSAIVSSLYASVMAGQIVYDGISPSFDSMMACNAMIHYYKDKNTAITKLLDELKPMMQAETQNKRNAKS